MSLEGPKPTGKAPEEVDLTGMLLPWEDGQPAMLGAPGSLLLYVPCFSTEEKLRALMERADVPFSSIKTINDGIEFLSDIRSSDGTENVRVVLDPYYLPNGRVRWTEVQEDLE